ncbi:MAG: hypothetical protein J5527_05505 [Treponema sp.]|nr:hypothetical protein [Treponema sp.]
MVYLIMASDVDKGGNKTKKTGGIALIISCVLVLCLFYSVLFRPQKEISIEENRTLQKVPAFSVKAFFKGTFQDEMERSIGDQLLFSIQIKYGVKQAFNFLTTQTAKLDGKSSTQKLTSTTSSSTTETPDSNQSVKEITSSQSNELIQTTALTNTTTQSNASTQSTSASDTTKTVPTTSSSASTPVQPDKNSYTYKEVVAGKLYKLDDSGYIVEKPHSPEEYEFELYDPKMLEAVTFPKYMYFIECSESADFNDLYKYNAFDYIKEHMPPMTGYDKLNYNSFDEYKTLFYQTDHHWNYHGSYIGYTQIIRMLEGPNVEVLKPVRTHIYNTIYNGSLARDNLLKCSTEKFTVYEYDLPPYKTYVNDEEKEYGYRSLYVSDDDFPHKAYSNHYGMYYGDDWAKVVYDFNCPEKENLLILGTSFTNSVNELLASHYNKTHVLDFRHYRKQYGERINAQKYMEENNISKMVIIGNISSLGYRINK